MTDRLPTYGGQAVIEGVIMRGGKSVAIAMRDPDQEIVIHTEELGGIYKSRLTKIPFLGSRDFMGCTWPWNACVIHLGQHPNRRR